MAKEKDRQPRVWVIITKQVAGRVVCMAGLRGSACNNAGQWGFFGGRIEPGETPAEAGERELHEETGMFLNPMNLQFLFKDMVGVKPTTWFTIDSVHVDQTFLKVTPETTDYEWIDITWGLRQDLHTSISRFFHYLVMKDQEGTVDRLGHLTAFKQKKLI